MSEPGTEPDEHATAQQLGESFAALKMLVASGLSTATALSGSDSCGPRPMRRE